MHTVPRYGFAQPETRFERERNRSLKTLSWRPISVLVVIVAALIYVLPTFRPGMWPHKKINLGLDLQGGMHLVLEVDTDKAVEDTIERLAQDLRTSIKKERVRIQGIDRVEENRIAVKGPIPGNAFQNWKPLLHR